MKSTLGLQEATAIAVTGFAHLAGDEKQLERFCALTGVAPGDLRSVASEPGFLAGILEFYLGHEPDLIAFAETHGVEPEQIAVAHRVLCGYAMP